ncbi:MAG: OsmC family protein [Candidatus Dormibacteraeota bacterium]|nr:OsmC family protein [Candidatus Dormibacteraeota bacterium]
MDGEQLRSIQAPLKARYRAESAAALVTLHAEGELGSEEISCSVQTGRALVEAGLHPGSGGDGSFACSGDMLLQALVACAGVTLRAVAINRGIALTGRVRAEGDLDFRGTMGVDPHAPVGFAAIRLRFELESDASPEDLDALLATTERYCVVFQTLTRPPDLSVSRQATNGSGRI